LRQALPHLKRLPSLETGSCVLSTAATVSQETIRKYIERQSKTEMDEQKTARKTFEGKLNASS
jgi:hypothetical protein